MPIVDTTRRPNPREMTAVLQRARSLAVGAGLPTLVGVLTPIWFAHDRTTRLLTSRRDGRTDSIDRVTADAIDVDATIRSRTPVIIRGLTAQLGIETAATPESIRARAGEAEMNVSFHDADAPYFLYSGGYGATISQRKTMSVSAFLDLMFGDGPPDGTVVYQLLGHRSVDGRIADELDEFDRVLAPLTSHPTAPQFSGVWIGSQGVVTPLHHDAWPGLLFQTHGRKRVAMYAPIDRANLSFRTPLAGEGRWSDLPARSSDADPADHPGLDHAVRYEAELDPGDALFIPPFWAHEMEAVEANVSVPFRFATFRRSHLNPGFLRPAAEMARARRSR